MLQLLENCVTAVQECMAQYEGTGTPPYTYFSKLRPSMVVRVHTKHMKEGLGSWEGFMKHCNLRPLTLTWGSYSMDRIDKMVLAFASASSTPDFMPTQNQLCQAKVDGANPHWETAHALASAISTHGELEASK